MDWEDADTLVWQRKRLPRVFDVVSCLPSVRSGGVVLLRVFGEALELSQLRCAARSDSFMLNVLPGGSTLQDRSEVQLPVQVIRKYSASQQTCCIEVACGRSGWVSCLVHVAEPGSATEPRPD